MWYIFMHPILFSDVFKLYKFLYFSGLVYINFQQSVILPSQTSVSHKGKILVRIWTTSPPQTMLEKPQMCNITVDIFLP